MEGNFDEFKKKMAGTVRGNGEEGDLFVSDDFLHLNAVEFCRMLPEKGLDNSDCELFYSLIYRLAGTVFGASGMCLKNLSEDECRLLSKLCEIVPALVRRGNADTKTPLIFDETAGTSALFFYRQFEEELTITRELLHRKNEIFEINAEQRAVIDAESDGFELCDEQKRAVEAILKNAVTIVRGGPGTGKTTLLLRALICLKIENPNAKIALAAPTGKAATRMKEALANQKYTGAGTQFFNEITELVPTTLHKLLGIHSYNLTPKTLDFDAIVVDEFSMVSQDLAAKIFKAIGGNARARLVFLGDENQLDSVEAGHVLGELALVENVFAKPELLESRRFNSKKFVGRFAQAIKDGNENFVEHLANEEKEDYCRLNLLGENPKIKELLETLIPETLRVPAGKSDEELLAAAENFKLITPTHAGTLGDEKLNECCAKICRGNADEDEKYFHGQVILLTEKDEDLGLVKGETGVIIENKEKHCFEAIFRKAENEIRKIKLELLPDWQLGYAITIHKSQGSEYRNLGVFVPAQCNENLLTKRLLYTAITRFKEDVAHGCQFSFFYSPESLKSCFNEKPLPPSLLSERLKKMAQK